jgi:hypothetical protein
MEVGATHFAKICPPPMIKAVGGLGSIQKLAGFDRDKQPIRYSLEVESCSERLSAAPSGMSVSASQLSRAVASLIAPMREKIRPSER